MPAHTVTPRDEPITSVLFVCTGNVCRSPFAAALLSHLAPALRVTSCGTDALVGARLDPLLAAHLPSGLAAADTHRARQLSMADLDADLVLTMSLRQRALLLDERPDAVRRLGLLGSVATLTRAGSGPLTRADVSAWSRLPADPAGEIADPYRRGEDAAAIAAQRITENVDRLSRLLA